MPSDSQPCEQSLALEPDSQHEGPFEMDSQQVFISDSEDLQPAQKEPVVDSQVEEPEGPSDSQVAPCQVELSQEPTEEPCQVEPSQEPTEEPCQVEPSQEPTEEPCQVEPSQEPRSDQGEPSEPIAPPTSRGDPPRRRGRVPVPDESLTVAERIKRDQKRKSSKAWHEKWVRAGVPRVRVEGAGEAQRQEPVAVPPPAPATQFNSLAEARDHFVREWIQSSLYGLANVAADADAYEAAKSLWAYDGRGDRLWRWLQHFMLGSGAPPRLQDVFSTKQDRIALLACLVDEPLEKIAQQHFTEEDILARVAVATDRIKVDLRNARLPVLPNRLEDLRGSLLLRLPEAIDRSRHQCIVVLLCLLSEVETVEKGWACGVKTSVGVVMLLWLVSMGLEGAACLLGRFQVVGFNWWITRWTGKLTSMK
eukprot:s2112_g1.t1